MNLNRFALTDRIAIVTGASQGIGEATAIVVAKAGADVVLASRNVKNLQKVAKGIEELGRKALVVPTDVTITSQIENMVKKTIAEFGRIDVLMNNAGGAAPDLISRILEISEEAWDKVVNLNLKAAFMVCRAVAPVMLQQGKGSIVNWSSVAGLMAYPLTPHYGAAKAGVKNLTATLAAEFAPKIRVNAVAPGPIETSGFTELSRRDPEVKEKRVRNILLKRLGQPEEVAYTALFLASDAASYITGETIVVSGGFTTFLNLGQ
jgi:NAD(P)-dependent dehydrogenase (short-subunit alcohol dehydrogenase family)